MVTGAFLRAFLAVAAVAVVVPAVAFALRASTPVGNPVAGKPLFVSTCGVCHRLREAKTVGVIGPNLDKVPLPEATIVKAITLGGASVMTKAQVAKYSTQMTAYRNVLSKKQIADIAAYVYKATHPANVASN
jgi:mono/diheme cytochrome c family protein